MRSRPNYYLVLPANVRYDNELSDSEKILYSEIVAPNLMDHIFRLRAYGEFDSSELDK